MSPDRLTEVVPPAIKSSTARCSGHVVSALSASLRSAGIMQILEVNSRLQSAVVARAVIATYRLGIAG